MLNEHKGKNILSKKTNKIDNTKPKLPNEMNTE